MNPPRTSTRTWLFATVHLSFADPQEQIKTEKTLQIDDFTKPMFWRFRTLSPDRHTYKYQLTLFRPDGTSVALPEQEESKEVLVLTPPQV